jgi:hypothetical protein
MSIKIKKNLKIQSFMKIDMEQMALIKKTNLQVKQIQNSLIQ